MSGRAPDTRDRRDQAIHIPHECSSYRLCKCHQASGCRCGGCPVARSAEKLAGGQDPGEKDPGTGKLEEG